MTLNTVLAIVAASASALLVVRKIHPAAGVVALLASAIEVLMAFGLLRLHVSGVSLFLLLGAALAAAGALLWARAGAKVAISAATLVLAVGAIQVLDALAVF